MACLSMMSRPIDEGVKPFVHGSFARFRSRDIRPRRAPTHDGGLFLFVNDAAIGIPGLYDYFYRNNRGVAKTDRHAEMMPSH